MPLFKPFDIMLGTFYLYQNIFATTVTASDQYMSIQLLEGKSLADKSFEFVFRLKHESIENNKLDNFIKLYLELDQT